MKEMTTMNDEQQRPWWRQGMVWLVIGGPAVVVVAGFATLAIAIAHPDPVLPTSDTPAVQARNHAASPSAPK
jgi:hypothetical protein